MASSESRGLQLTTYPLLAYITTAAAQKWTRNGLFGLDMRHGACRLSIYSMSEKRRCDIYMYRDELQIRDSRSKPLRGPGHLGLFHGYKPPSIQKSKQTWLLWVMINKTRLLLVLDSWTYSWAPLALRRFLCCLPEPRQEAYLCLGPLAQPKFKMSARYRSFFSVSLSEIPYT